MPPTTPQPQGAARLPDTGSPATALRLDVVSDVICPWCHIGRARLARALGKLSSGGIAVQVTWRPFELNPDMPPEGMSRRDYRTRKFGSWERSRMLDEQVVREGRAEGLEFAYDRVSRTPSTRRAHRLVHRAHREGGAELQDQLVGRLFSAYFDTGEDVGEPDTLVGIARACGMNAAGLGDYLRSTEDEDIVVGQEMLAVRAGVQGVPSVLHGDLVLFSGALPADDIVGLIQVTLERRPCPDTTTPGTSAQPVGGADRSIFDSA